MIFGSKSRKSHFWPPKSLFREIITFLVILAFSGPGGGKVDFYAKSDFLVKMTSKIIFKTASSMSFYANGEDGTFQRAEIAKKC